MKFLHMINFDKEEGDKDGNYWICEDCCPINEKDRMIEYSPDPFGSLICHVCGKTSPDEDFYELEP